MKDNLLHDRYNILEMVLLQMQVFSIKETFAHTAYFADKESVLLIRAYILLKPFCSFPFPTKF